MIRRFGAPPEAARSYIRRPGAYGLLPLGKRLLLTCQTAPEPDLQLPGGGIDPGESPVAALHREVLEETGWHIAAPRRVGAFREFVYMPEYDQWAEKICLIFVARPVLRLGSPSEPNHEICWMGPEAAGKELSNVGNRYFARQYAKMSRDAAHLTAGRRER